jgi:hypothetical protein
MAARDEIDGVIITPSGHVAYRGVRRIGNQ